MNDMKRVHIVDKLRELGTEISDVNLGDFDGIGEFCAKKSRTRDNPQYATAGAFFRPNYERGILIDAMIKKYHPTRILEIGFGRGYWAMCAARAMTMMGIEGKIQSIDLQYDKQQIEKISQIFPHEWLEKLELFQGASADLLNDQLRDGKWDIVYIDGAHTYNAVKSDWDLVKNRADMFVVFDDYSLVQNTSPDIQVRGVVDEHVTWDKELVHMDRLIFCDERTPYRDNDMSKLAANDYGQVIARNPMYVDSVDAYSYDWDR